jgi:putative aldouronate transport system permease protein
MSTNTVAPGAARQADAPARRTLWQHLRRFVARNGALLLMALPGLSVLFVFSYMPMPGIVLAFKDYKAAHGIWGSAWVGFSNFQFLFGTDTAWRIIRNTLFINALFIISTLVVALTLALLLNEVIDSFIAKVYQSILFFPFFVSYVIVGYFVFIFLSSDAGIINSWLVQIGLKPVNWFNSPQYWPIILVIVNLWHNVGFNTIIYLAGLIAINPEYYEAARLDGANKWQEIRYIQLPLLRPLIIINVLLAIGRIFFANFDLFINSTRMQGSLLSTTDVIDTYVFRTLTALGNFNMASAAGLFQAVAGFVLIVLANWIVRRVDPDQALF